MGKSYKKRQEEQRALAAKQKALSFETFRENSGKTQEAMSFQTFQQGKSAQRPTGPSEKTMSFSSFMQTRPTAARGTPTEKSAAPTDSGGELDALLHSSNPVEMNDWFKGIAPETPAQEAAGTGEAWPEWAKKQGNLWGTIRQTFDQRAADAPDEGPVLAGTDGQEKPQSWDAFFGRAKSGLDSAMRYASDFAGRAYRAAADKANGTAASEEPEQVDSEPDASERNPALEAYEALTPEEQETLELWWNDSYYEYASDEDVASGFLEKDPRQTLEEKYGADMLRAMYEAAVAPIQEAEAAREAEAIRFQSMMDAAAERRENAASDAAVRDADMERMGTFSDAELQILFSTIGRGASADDFSLQAAYAELGVSTWNPWAMQKKQEELVERAGGEDAVRELWETYDREHNAQGTEAMEQYGRDLSAASGVAGFLGARAANLFSALGSFGEAAANVIPSIAGRTGRYSTADPNSGNAWARAFSSGADEVIVESLEALAGENKVARFILTHGYNAFGQAGDNILRNLSLGPFGLAFMGADSFNRAWDDAAEAGIDPGRALAVSVIKGAAEVGTEKIPFDTAMKSLAGESTVRDIMIGFFGEVAGEELSELIGDCADEVILLDDSERNQKIEALLSNGYSYAEASALVNQEYAQKYLDILVETILSSGVSEGAVYMAGKAMNNERQDGGNDSEILNSSEEANVQDSGEDARSDSVPAENAAEDPEAASEAEPGRDPEVIPEMEAEDARSGQEATAAEDTVQETAAERDAKESETDADTIAAGMQGMKLSKVARPVIENGYQPGGSITAEEYALGVREAYRYGQNGQIGDLNRGEGFSGKLDERVRLAAYNAGKIAGGKQVALETAKVKARMVSGRAQTGMVHYDGDRSALSHLQRTSLDVMDTVASILGKDIYIYESTGQERAEGAPNGWYDPADASIHIDLNAGADGKGAMLFTVAHELTHYARDWSPAGYKRLTNFLFENYGEAAASVEDLIANELEYQKKQERNQGKSAEELYAIASEEVVAKSMEAMLSDGKLAEKLAKLKQTDHGTWQMLKDWISQLAQRIKAVYQSLKPDSKEGRMVAQMMDSIDQIQNLIAEALDDASRNEQAARERGNGKAEKNTTREGGVKYQPRVNPGLSDMERYEILKDTTVTIPEYSQEMEHAISRQELDSLTDIDRKTARNILRALGDRYQAFRTFKDGDVELEFSFSHGGLEESINKMRTRDYRQYAKFLTVIDDVIRGSVEIEEHGDRYGNNHSNIKATHVLVGAFRDGGITPVKMEVREFTDSTQSKLYVAVTLGTVLDTKEEATIIARIESPFGDTHVPYVASTITLQQLASLVNTEDGTLLKYFPDQMLDGARLQAKQDALSETQAYIDKKKRDKLWDGSVKLQSRKYITDSEGRELSEGQQEYFKDSKVRDGSGKLMPLYHQTGAQFYVFDTRRAGAGASDNGTPFGVFLKSSPEDIGLKGKLQKKLYANITNPLRAENRDQLAEKMRKISPEYGRLLDERTELDDDYHEKYESAQRKFREYVEKWRADNPNASRRALYDVAEFNELFDAEDVIVDEWEEKGAALDRNAKEVLTLALQDAGYDGIILAQDAGSFGRSTDAYIALNPEQVKDTDNLNPTANPDIRYQQRMEANVDGQETNTAEIAQAQRNNPYSYQTLVQKSPIPKTWVEDDVTMTRADLVRAAIQNAAQIGQQSGKAAIVHVNDVDREVKLTEDGLRHGLDRRFRQNAPATLHAGEILQNAIRINELVPRNDSTKSTYVLIGAAENSKGDLHIVEFVVNDKDTVESVDVLYSVNTKINQNLKNVQKNKSQSGSTPQGITGKPASPSGSTITVADLLENVNHYFPDVLPEDVLKYFGHDSRPSGKLGAGALFQKRMESSAKAVQALERENAKLREDLEDAKELLALQGKVTGGTIVTRSSKKSMADILLKQYDAKGDGGELAELLDDVYRYIATGDELTMEGVYETAGPAAQYIMDHLNQKQDGYAKEVLAQMKGTHIKLDAAQLQEAASLYGSMLDFRKAIAGTVVLGGDGAISLDSWWQAMASQFPDFFDADRNSNDMPGALVQAVESLRSMKTDITDEFGAEAVRRSILQDVYDSYWKVSTLRTVADRYQKQINALKGQHAERMAALRRDRNSTIAQLKVEQKMRLTNARMRYRDDLIRQQKDLTQKYRDQRRAAAQGREKTALRHKILNTVKTLNQMLLTNTGAKHVPDGMKKAVAEALEIVNFDWDGQAERRNERMTQKVAALQRELARATTQEDVERLAKKISGALNRSQRMDEQLARMKAAYDSIRTDEELADSFDENVSALMELCINAVGDTQLNDMNLHQLETVHDMYNAVLATVRNANKLFAENLKAGSEEVAAAIHAEVRAQDKGRRSESSARRVLSREYLNNLKPTYFFVHLKSPTLATLYRNLEKGQEKWAVISNEAHEVYTAAAEKHHFQSWDFDRKYSFESTNGEKLSMNLQQIMSLYAYSKRDNGQGRNHINKGGIVIDQNTKIGGGLFGKQFSRGAKAYSISDMILDDIIGNLTTEQRAFVDDTQGYLGGQLADYGNEVSMALYNIRLFKEKNYFPLRSSDAYLPAAKKEGEKNPRIKNWGSAKALVPHASNPIVLSEYSQTWGGHVEEMARYAGLTLPEEDFYRAYNYKTKLSDGTGWKSINADLQDTFGKGAADYIDTLLNDINGGMKADPREGFAGKLVGRMKAAAVGANLSVVAKQYGAVFRASAYIDLKYFVGRSVERAETDGQRMKRWEELKKYAPVAIIKEMGYFDVGMGRTGADWVISLDKQGWDKVRGIFTDADYRNELIGWAPGKMDELGWGTIWEAAKRETRTKTGLTGEALLKAAGERFTEVVNLTQVYDSTFSRSANMRSKSGLVKMATAFMAEPTVNLNMLTHAAELWQQGKRKEAGRQFHGIYMASLVTAVMAAVVGAGRDDDKETWLEKYFGAVLGNIISDGNPLNWIPYVKDVLSLWQGYDVERTDMTMARKLVNAFQNMGKDSKSTTEKILGMVGSLSDLFGIPVNNVVRDMKMIQNTMNSTPIEKENWRGIWYAVTDSLPGLGKTKSEKLLESMADGDALYMERMEDQYATDSAFNSAVKKAVKEGWESGEITREEAVAMLQQYHDAEKAEATVTLWEDKRRMQEELPGYGWSDAAITRYYAQAEPAGIPADVYDQYLTQKGSDTSKEKLLPIIDALPLTADQKDALYRTNNWKESTLQDAPWH